MSQHGALVLRRSRRTNHYWLQWEQANDDKGDKNKKVNKIGLDNLLIDQSAGELRKVVIGSYGLE